jgi:hypothetical protein
MIVSALMLSACASMQNLPADAMQGKPAAGEAMMDDASKDAMADTDMGNDTMTPESGSMEGEASMPSGDHTGEMIGKTPEADMSGMSKSDQAMQDSSMSGEAAVMEIPAWFNAELVDVRSGESFHIADFESKVVLVETMAIWCSSCLRQQQQVKALHALLGERDDFISLGLDIDPNEEAKMLKNYTEQNYFDWMYAISPAEVSRELGQLYGAQYLNPPSTPMLIIDRHGEAHMLPFGIKSTEDLFSALQPFLDESM